MCFFFFKQKTAYEMRISDWSSDVCSSDLLGPVQDDQIVSGAEDSGATKAQAEGNAAALSILSEDGRTGLIAAEFDVDTPMEIEPARQDQVKDAMGSATAARATPQPTGHQNRRTAGRVRMGRKGVR